VHRALRAIATGKQRLLLLMATGTGKTFTAMQLVAKLYAHERAVHPDRNYRVLYLADLDVLLKQPMDKDFQSAFGTEPMKRVRGRVDRSREIYFASYQAMSGPGDESTLFADYPSDFFDLVIVDECHRGSASAGSSWRSVLEHFAPAVQLGLTATPKRDDNVDTYEYFGNPLFTYSLRQGIEEGFLRAIPRTASGVESGRRGVDPEPRGIRPSRTRDSRGSLRHARVRTRGIPIDAYEIGGWSSFPDPTPGSDGARDGVLRGPGACGRHAIGAGASQSRSCRR